MLQTRFGFANWVFRYHVLSRDLSCIFAFSSSNIVYNKFLSLSSLHECLHCIHHFILDCQEGCCLSIAGSEVIEVHDIAWNLTSLNMQSRNKGQGTVRRFNLEDLCQAQNCWFCSLKLKGRPSKLKHFTVNFPLLSDCSIQVRTIQVLIHACWSCFWAAAAINTNRLKSLLSRLY